MYNLEKIWPDWKIVKLIGEGSFGKVYEIVRNNYDIEEHCALKVISIPPSEAELKSLKNDGMDDRSATAYLKGLVSDFVQEIAMMLKLKGNINIVGYDDYTVVEHTDGIGWDILIRMELLTDLPSYIRTGAMNERGIVKLAIDLCSALEECHAQKIIHRDIKPDNIFVSANGDFKLGDFGVARTIEKTTSNLSKKGTYTYMAPEVYKGEEYGLNADLYSLGMVLYRLLNDNREPFLPPAPNPIIYSDRNNALVERIKGGEILPPKNGSKDLKRIVLKSLSYAPELRYSNASEMKAELEQVSVTDSDGYVPPYIPPEEKNDDPPMPNPKKTVEDTVGPFSPSNNKDVPPKPREEEIQVVAEQKRKDLLRFADLMGWGGLVFWLSAAIALLFFGTFYLIFPVAGLLVTQIKFTSKKGGSFGDAVFMLICCILSIGIINLPSAIIYLNDTYKYKNSKQ